jgi:outer membrane immunogenic protein
MRMGMRVLGLGAAAVLASVSVASAADLGGPPAPPYASYAPEFDWSGLYFGIQGGYDWNRATTPPFAASETGVIAGFYGGYNFQFDPNWIVGFDASINWDNARGGDPDVGVPNSAGPTWKGFVRGRAGYVVDNFLFYATGGAAVMSYSAVVSGVGSGNATPWGWTAGLGVEMALSENWIGRIDYAYQDFGTFTLGGAAPVGGTPVSLTASTLMVGIARKF